MSTQPNLLVIGVGSIGERHLRCFLGTGRASLAFCEPLTERRKQVAEQYAVQGYASWEEALETESFDAAIIASPAPFHIPTARALTEKGIDLLVEKPLSLDLDGIPELCELVRKQSTRVAVGYFYRSLPALGEMRQSLLAGRFGKIVQVNVTAGQHFPYYRPAYRDIYFTDPNQGGGLIQDMLPHHLNAVEWIAGPATRVVVDASHQVLDGIEVEDTVHLLSRHSDIMASFTVNLHQPVNETVITVNCEKGAARWELLGERWFSATENGGEWKEESCFAHQRDDYYIGQANAFLDYLSGASEAHCSLEAGIATLKATLAILESRKRGTWVNV